jgi:hypothetical protein
MGETQPIHSAVPCVGIKEMTMNTLTERYSMKINGEMILTIQAPPQMTGEHLVSLLKEAIKEIRREMK